MPNGFVYSSPGALTSAWNTVQGQDGPALGTLSSAWNSVQAAGDSLTLGPLSAAINEVQATEVGPSGPIDGGIYDLTGVLLEGTSDFPDAYIMRAFKTTPTTGFVYWIVYDEPDLTGSLSGYPPVDLADIVIVREPCLP